MKTIIKVQCLVVLVSVGFLLKIIMDNESIKNMDILNIDDKLGANDPNIQAGRNPAQHHPVGHPEVTMEEHMRFYKLNPEVHYSCSKTRRPKPEDIEWRKNVYQRIVLKFEDHPENEVFGMKFYFDDRFLQDTGERHIRGIITIHGPGHLKNAEESKPVLEWAWAMNRSPWQVLMWYDSFEDPVGVRCKIQAAGGLNRNVSNTFFFQEIVTCIVPEIGALPTSVSIVRRPCDKPVTDFEIIYPEPEATPGSRNIGMCLASFYGNLSQAEVPYFVNWMEALNVLGIKEVSINNGTLKFMDPVIKKAFEYYQGIGRLHFTHYPPVHTTWNSPDEDDAATEAVNKMTTGDCIYRNLKRYWYVLIADMDELPVPTYFDTYQEYISDYTEKHPNITHAHCLTVRSSFFYQELPPGNPEYGEHLPVLRLTKRFRPEPIEVDGVGISKSFHNMRNMVAAGHHLTRQTHTGGGPKNLLHHFMSPDEILIHHYRRTCKWKAYCREHWNETIHDDIIPRKFGNTLKANIENALRSIGYDF